MVALSHFSGFSRYVRNCGWSMDRSCSADHRNTFLVVAAIYMQKATNLKRIFAYSTVEHMGLVLIALSLGKTGILLPFYRSYFTHL